jgi:hypothetical protein
MPPLPPDQPAQPSRVVMIKSPRDAATWAIVYRRKLRDKPRDRLLKVIAMFGALLVHVLFLLGMVLGPAYVLPPSPPEPKGNALLVKLIEKKPQPPPPPPPIRGIPPKEHGPTHRGNTSQVAHVTHEASTAAPVAAVQQPPAPTPKQQPVVSQAKQTVAVKARPPAAPLPPITLPKTAPVVLEQPKLVGVPPPTPTVPATPVPQPVPPPFQPEPPRKPQVEGTQPMPPLPSLAVPIQPAQSPLTAAPPQIAVEKPSIEPIPIPNVAPAAPAPAPAAPPSPPLEPIPLPAQQAPTVNLQPSEAPVKTPLAPQLSQQPLGPIAKPSEPEPQLAPIPLTPTTTPAPTMPPAAPSPVVAAPKIAVPAVSVAPLVSPAPAPSPSSPQTKAPSSPSNEKPTAESSPSAPNNPSPASPGNEGNTSVSTAPNATPQGSETGNPGSPNGGTKPSETNGPPNGQSIPVPGAGSAAGSPNGGTPGTPNGTYIQLKPRGDTEIMSHNTNLPKYNPTVFDKYWTPKGESSVDTALRHAVEKTTVSHTFNLPQGIRIECSVMPLLPSSLLGCHNPDPPAVPLPKKIYDRLNLPTNNASIPKTPAVAASAPAPASSVTLNNDAECAAARVSGGPLPPNCGSTETVKPLHLPTSSSSSWVPASDQFH